MAGSFPRAQPYPLREPGLLRWGRMNSSERIGPCRCHRNRSMMVSLGLLAALVLSFSVKAQDSNNTTPFGPISEVDIDQLMKFGRTRGFDLQPEMQRIYRKDEEALARLFNLSLGFKRFDRKARTYGQVMYSCWLRF